MTGICWVHELPLLSRSSFVRKCGVTAFVAGDYPLNADVPRLIHVESYDFRIYGVIVLTPLKAWRVLATYI